MQVKTYLISKAVSYHELILEDGYINKIYMIDNPDREIYAIPDACLDLQFVYEKGRFVPYVCGTHTEVSLAFISGSKKIFGVKFEPGVVPDFMKSYAGELVCTRRNVSDMEALSNIAVQFRKDMSFEDIIDKDTFYRVQERIELIRSKHLEGSKPNPEAPKKPDNILVYKTKCACCGGSVLIIRHHTYSDRFMYKCSKRRKLTALCENKSSYEYNEVMDSVFSVIRQHMKLCIEKTKFVQKMNNRKENILQYDIYTKQIAKLQNDVRRITANKSGLYEDYREQLITAEELCQYQKEYESRVNEIEAQITELLYRRSLYEKDFHIDEGWEETVNKYLSKRKLTRELVEAFVSEIVFTDNNIEVKLLYDDFLKELLEVAEEREVGSNG